jgi:hypothetical protein
MPPTRPSIVPMMKPPPVVKLTIEKRAIEIPPVISSLPGR